MNIEIVRFGIDDLGADSALPFDDPHGLCQVTPERLAAFRSNPFRRTQNDVAQLIGVVDGCAAGRIMFLPGELVAAGEAFPVRWCCHLYVVPEFRKTLLAFRLVEEARQGYNVVGGSRLSREAFPIFSRLGWTEISLHRYVMPCRVGPFLKHFLGPGRLAALLSPALDPALMIHRSLLKAREKVACANLRCEPTPSVPESLDSALAELNRTSRCHRSSRWLNWVLRNSYGTDPREKKSFYLVRDRKNQIVAYFVTRLKFYEELAQSSFRDLLIGSVLDWGVFDPSAVREAALWLMATNTLAADGVDLVEICVSSPNAAMPFGFRRYGKHRCVLWSNSNTPAVSGDQAARWVLRQIDGDSGLA